MLLEVGFEEVGGAADEVFVHGEAAVDSWDLEADYSAADAR